MRDARSLKQIALLFYPVVKFIIVGWALVNLFYFGKKSSHLQESSIIAFRFFSPKTFTPMNKFLPPFLRPTLALFLLGNPELISAQSAGNSGYDPCSDPNATLSTVCTNNNRTCESAEGYFILEIEGCNIEDAYTGLTLDEGTTANVFPPVYRILGNYFFNNYTGISNLRQNNQALNAIISGNQFYTTAALRPVPVSMQALALTDYPFGHAGVEYIRTTSAVGVTTGVSTARNSFSCLVHGIIAEDCALSVHSNDFFDLHSAGYGIKAIDGVLSADDNTFINNGQYCIYADGVHLDATANTFYGDVEYGINSHNNLQGEFVNIYDGNIFQINTPDWVDGIYLERSHATGSTPHNTIVDNDFVVSGSPFGTDFAIHYQDFAFANDECVIQDNIFTIQSGVTSWNDCVHVFFGNSNKVKVLDNTMHYLPISYPSGPRGWGVAAERGAGYHNASTGHVFKHNTVVGVANGSTLCSFHTDRISNLEFCDNTVDYSAHGFHFYDENAFALRENKINHHGFGLFLQANSGPAASVAIGSQGGRGNTWSTDPNACVNKAINNANTLTSITSGFFIHESNLLPYLPPASKIDPDPTILGPGFEWVKHDPTVGEDYCTEQSPGPEELGLAPFELSIIEGSGAQTGAQLWDMQREIYTKLLLHPALRPSGSPAETFFNNLSNTALVGFAEVERTVEAGLSMSQEDEETIRDAHTEIVEAWADIRAAEVIEDFSSDPELSDEWYDDRVHLLQNIQFALGEIASVENEQASSIADALQDAITANNAVATSADYEIARQTANDYRLRRLAGEPLTESAYAQIAALAQDMIPRHWARP